MQENPRGPFRYDAQKYIAEIVETNFKDYDQAIIEYQNLIDRNQVPEDNPEHQFKIATLFIKKQSYDQAVVEFELLLENILNPTGRLRPNIKLLSCITPWVNARLPGSATSSL